MSRKCDTRCNKNLLVLNCRMLSAVRMRVVVKCCLTMFGVVSPLVRCPCWDIIKCHSNSVFIRISNYSVQFHVKQTVNTIYDDNRIWKINLSTCPGCRIKRQLILGTHQNWYPKHLVLTFIAVFLSLFICMLLTNIMPQVVNCVAQRKRPHHNTCLPHMNICI